MVMGSYIGSLKVAAKRVGMSLVDYTAKVESGLKRCHKCEQWRAVRFFGKDRTRFDGVSAVCLDCRCNRTQNGPARPARKFNRNLGIAWCRGCRKWLPATMVRGGSCRPCTNTTDRTRYARDLDYRAERKQHAKARKRGVAPIPVSAQQDLMERFDGRCAYCPAIATSWDHIHPVSKAGRTSQGNIVPCCMSCNSSKRNMDPDEWIDARLGQCHPALIDILVIDHVTLG